MNLWVPDTGIIKYDPPRNGIKKVRPGSVLVVDVDYGIAEYYRWWVKKHFHLTLQNNAWRPHITVIDGRVPLNQEQMKLWKKYEKQVAHFEYSVDIKQHWKFWTLPVQSEQLTEIRKELGMSVKYPFHITFGRMD